MNTRRGFISLGLTATTLAVISPSSLMLFGLCEHCGNHPKLTQTSQVRVDLPEMPIMFRWSCLIQGKRYDAATLMYGDFDGKIFLTMRKIVCLAYLNRIKVLRGEAKESDFA